MSFLRHYQEAPAATLLDSLSTNGVALDASDTGIGKTFHALGAIHSLESVNFAVVCRATAVHKWEKAIEECGLKQRCVFVTSWQKMTGGKRFSEYVVRQKLVKRSTYSWRFTVPTVVIFDEVQDAGGEKSLNSQLLIGAGRSSCVYPLCLSATAADSPIRMKALGFILGMHKGVDHWAWCKKNGCGEGHFGGLYFRVKDRKWALESLNSQMFPKFGVRVKREEVAEYMPKETVQVELWDCPATTAKPVLLALEKITSARDEDIERHEEGVPGGVTMMRDRMESEILKVPTMVEEIVAAVENGMSCPVFLNFSGSIDLASELLRGEKIEHGVFDGRENKHVRQNNLDKFQAGKIPVLLVQTQAGSASIDMHDTTGKHPRCSFISPSFVAEHMIQMLGRSARLEAKSPVLQRIVFSEGTVEERVYKVAERKCENIRALNDGEWLDAWGRPQT